MIYPRFQVWFALAALVAPNAMAFSPSKPPAASDGQLSSSISQDFNRDEIDISGVMSEVDAALQMAAGSTDSIEGELVKFTDELNLKAKLGDIQEVWESTDEKNQKVATAVAGSALGVLAGSPLVLGAALGLAGSQWLDDSEEGLKNRETLEKAGIQVTDQLKSAIEFAQAEIEKEEDPSKIPEKMVLALQNRASDLQSQANEAPALVATAVKEKLESEQFKAELKQAPARAFGAVKEFLQSEEVKAASGSVFKALKETMDSEEVKALQARASQAVKESLKTKSEA